MVVWSPFQEGHGLLLEASGTTSNCCNSSPDPFQLVFTRLHSPSSEEQQTVTSACIAIHALSFKKAHMPAGCDFVKSQMKFLIQLHLEGTHRQIVNKVDTKGYQRRDSMHAHRMRRTFQHPNSTSLHPIRRRHCFYAY